MTNGGPAGRNPAALREHGEFDPHPVHSASGDRRRMVRQRVVTPRARALSESSILSGRPAVRWSVAPLVRRVACHVTETGSIPVRTAVVVRRPGRGGPGSRLKSGTSWFDSRGRHTQRPCSSVVEHSPGTGAAQVRLLAGAHVPVAQVDQSARLRSGRSGVRVPPGALHTAVGLVAQRRSARVRCVRSGVRVPPRSWSSREALGSTRRACVRPSTTLADAAFRRAVV